MTLKRHKAKRIALYNHKGGVGKTTLTVNIAAALAQLGKRVLVVDSDPQSNVTSYLISEDVLDELLDNSDLENGQTIWSVVKPIDEAQGDVKYITPIETLIENLFLVPGDIKLADFEVSLGEFWSNCYERKVKGYRGVSAISNYLNNCAENLNLDYIFYDTGPNIGPLNKVILLDCDFFIVPVACDLYSKRALKTLGKTISSWIHDWRIISSIAPDNEYLIPGKPRFMGYIPQKFRIYRGIMSNKSATYLSKIEKSIFSDVISVINKADPSLASKKKTGIKLGEIKDYTSLVQEAQLQGTPLSEVTDSEYSAQAKTAKIAFEKIANTIIKKSN